MDFFPQDNKGYRKDIDGLRGIAVLAVLIYHLAPDGLSGGYLGVDVFFVISGFLISGIIFKDLLNNNFSFKRFYLGRLRRIIPALLLVLLFVIIFGWIILFPNEYKILGKHILFSVFNLVNIVFWRESGYFDIDSVFKPLLHLWSLGVEEQFYLFFPLFMCIIFKLFYKTTKIIVWACCLLIVLSLGAHVYLADSSAGFYLPFSRVWELMCGVVLCLSLRFGLIEPFKNNKIVQGDRFKSLISIIGLLIVLVVILLDYEKIKRIYLANIIIIIGTMLVIGAGENGLLNKYILSSKPARALGVISYPLYLWHWPLISFYCIGYHDDKPRGITRLVIIVISLFLSILTYFFIEYPIRFNIKYRLQKHIIIGSLMIIISITGFYIYKNNGLLNRPITVQFEQRDFQSLVYTYPPSHDEACRQYVINQNHPDLLKLIDEEPVFFFCRYSDVGSNKTIAIVGDSHAMSAIEGFNSYGKSHDINILFLGRPGHLRPFIGAEESIEESRRQKWIEARDYIYEIFANDSNIYSIYIITAAPEQDIVNKTNILEIIKNSFQATIDFLVLFNKNVYILSDVPVLDEKYNYYLERPFFKKPVFKLISRENALEYQKKYVEMLYSLKNVTVIDCIDFFCPGEYCRYLSDDRIPLYYDDNHLSIAGSYFLADSLVAAGLFP